MKIDDLTLGSIDSMRHLATSEVIVNAVHYAARMGQSEATAYRFITALVMTDNLIDRTHWLEIIQAVAELEEAAGLRR